MSKTKGNFAKKSSRNHQKKYKNKTHKNYLGGTTDVPLAYTGKPIFSVPNPNLAYTGKGGSSCGLSNTANMPINTNAENPAYPNTGPISAGNNIIFNNSSAQLGGSCNSCNFPLMTGGKKNKKGGFMVGGSQHRNGCKCSECKKRRNYSNMKGGNAGIPYPNGLVGSPWTPNISGWPGVNGIPGDRNYFSQNEYKVDPQTSMVDLGANPPFLNMNGGKIRKQKGGSLSNFIGQDLVNLGRQFQFGLGSAYNALAGYAVPVNPLPWKDQLPTKLSINPSIV